MQPSIRVKRRRKSANEEAGETWRWRERLGRAGRSYRQEEGPTAAPAEVNCTSWYQQLSWPEDLLTHQSKEEKLETPAWVSSPDQIVRNTPGWIPTRLINSYLIIYSSWKNNMGSDPNPSLGWQNSSSPSWKKHESTPNSFVPTRLLIIKVQLCFNFPNQF